MFSSFDNRLFRNKSYDFSPGNADSSFPGRAAYFVESLVEGSLGSIGDVHRHLGYAVFVDEPSDGLCPFQGSGNHQCLPGFVLEGFARQFSSLALRAPFLADIERNGVGPTGGCGIEIEVYGNQEIAGSYCGRSRAGYAVIEGAVAEVRSLGGPHAFGKSLVFSFAAYGEILAFGSESRSLVCVDWYVEFFGHPFSQFAGKGGTFFESHSRNRHQRTHVRCPHTGMRAVVFAHVYKLGCAPYAAESGFNNFLRFSDEGHYRAVGGFSRVDIQKSDSFSFTRKGDGVGNGADYIRVSSLAEIRDTFDNSFFHGTDSKVSQFVLTINMLTNFTANIIIIL